MPAVVSPVPVVKQQSRAEEVKELDAALAASPPGKWHELWAEYARSASADDLTALAGKPESRACQLAWEELAVRQPGVLTGLARRMARKSPALVAAGAAALVTADPEAAWALAVAAGNPVVSNAVLTALAWRDPLAAKRKVEGLAPRIDASTDGDTMPPNQGVAMGWTRRDPKPAAEAGYCSWVTWARMDALAALDFELATKGDDEERGDHWEVQKLSLIALRQSPAEMAKRLAASPMLRQVCGSSWHSSTGPSALAHWYLAAPDDCLAWFSSGEAAKWTAKWKQDMQFPAMLLKDLARFEPEAVEPLVARIPASGFSLSSKGLGYIAQEDPALAARLAAKLGETLPEDRGAKYQAMEDDPLGTCDAWLAALEKMPPEDALEACGLEARQAGRLAGFMTQVFPEKAKALAAKVPWESLKISTGSVPEAAEQDMRRLWKAPAGDKADARGFLLDGSLDTLQSDPARYAAAVDPSGAQGWGAWNVAVNWAPHDLAAATAWVQALPDGAPRRKAEVALAMELSVRNPEAGLAAMAALPEGHLGLFVEPCASAWITALHHVVLTGGDWQAWKARTPAPLRERVNYLAPDRGGIHHDTGAFGRDAELLAALRGAVGK